MTSSKKYIPQGSVSTKIPAKDAWFFAKNGEVKKAFTAPVYAKVKVN